MKNILKKIEEAIEDEREAQKKYAELKKQAENEKIKSLYEQLIQDEKKHEETLRSRYQALKKAGNTS